MEERKLLVVVNQKKKNERRNFIKDQTITYSSSHQFPL